MDPSRGASTHAAGAPPLRLTNRTPMPIGTTTESISRSASTSSRKSAISSRWLITLSASTRRTGNELGRQLASQQLR